MQTPVILEIAICVLLFVIVFIMPAFVIGALAKFTLAPCWRMWILCPGTTGTWASWAVSHSPCCWHGPSR